MNATMRLSRTYKPPLTPSLASLTADMEALSCVGAPPEKPGDPGPSLTAGMAALSCGGACPEKPGDPGPSESYWARFRPP